MSARGSGADTAEARRAIAAAAKTKRFGGWYVAEHRFLVMRSYLQTVVVTSFGNPLMYLFAMGVGLASLIDTNMSGPAGGGVGYLQFVAPALLCMAAVTVASEEFTYPIMLGFKWNPIFYGMNASPISAGQIVDGMVYSITARIVGTCGIYYLFMLLFGAVPSPWGAVSIAIATLTGLGFGAMIMAYVATLEQDAGQIAMIMRFGLLPMTLFSGTFFPLDSMPVYLQWIGWVSPLWHGVELSRVFSYGLAEPVWLSGIHLGYLVALIVVGWLLTRRIAAARLNK